MVKGVFAVMDTMIGVCPTQHIASSFVIVCSSLVPLSFHEPEADRQVSKLANSPR